MPQTPCKCLNQLLGIKRISMDLQYLLVLTLVVDIQFINIGKRVYVSDACRSYHNCCSSVFVLEVDKIFSILLSSMNTLNCKIDTL